MRREHREAAEVRILRERLIALESAIDRRADSASGSVVGVGVTYQFAAYPTAPNAFYAVRPATIVGAEVEGGTATLQPGGGSIFALNLGSQSPPPGTEVRYALCGDRYVFRFDG